MLIENKLHNLSFFHSHIQKQLNVRYYDQNVVVSQQEKYIHDCGGFTLNIFLKSDISFGYPLFRLNVHG